jgi:DNA-binding LytR/AlgR family response regulator
MGFDNNAARAIAVDRRFGGPVLIAGAWTVVALAAAVQAIALGRLDGRVNLLGAVLGRVAIIPLWAIATPLIFRSARRFPVMGHDRRPNPRSIAVHLALGSLFIVMANFAIRVPFAIAHGRTLDALVQSTIQGVAEYYPAALVVYGVIVAIGHYVYRTRGPMAAPNAATLADLPAESEVAVEMAVDNEVPAAAPAHDGHLTVRQWNRVHLIPVDEIDFVEAEDNYVVVHAGARAYKGRDRISDVEAQLDTHRFVRIHRSTIVQVGKIREVQPLTHGDHAVVLRDGKVLRVARSRRQALEQALGIEL